MKGLERLKERGVEYAAYDAIGKLIAEISESEHPNYTTVRPSVPTVRVLDAIADAVCDLLDRQDQIEGEMDNPEHPDVEMRMTERMKNTDKGRA